MQLQCPESEGLCVSVSNAAVNLIAAAAMVIDVSSVYHIIPRVYFPYLKIKIVMKTLLEIVIRKLLSFNLNN